MFHRFFRKQIPTLPVSTAELSAALRVARQFADSDEAKLEYGAAADALDRAITHTRKHADAPTRDALAYALGRAELNLKDELRELIEVGKETRLLVQDVHSAQSTQGAAVHELRAEFQQVAERITESEQQIGSLRQKVAEHDESRDRSLQDRRMLREDMDESKQHRARIQHTLNTELPAIRQELTDLSAAVQEIQRLLEIAGDNHEAGG